jgi:hypothetical protein
LGKVGVGFPEMVLCKWMLVGGRFSDDNPFQRSRSWTTDETMFYDDTVLVSFDLGGDEPLFPAIVYAGIAQLVAMPSLSFTRFDYALPA